MSTNISKQKREDLLAKIKEIRTFISAAPQDENTGNLLSYLSELEKDVNGKKYGLVFEEHREEIDEVLDTHTPVLTESKDLFIDNGGQMNFLIEGDNLASLKLLEKTHKGRIDLIYIDPPYNRGKKDFIYDDDYIESDDTFKHSKWISFMKPRLQLAHGLLCKHGNIFISCDDNEVATIRLLCDEIFGDKNFQGHIHWRRRHNQPNDKNKLIGLVTEHIIVYSKDADELKKYGIGKIAITGNYTNPDNDPKGPWTTNPWKAARGRGGCEYTITTPTGIQLTETWYGTQETFEKNLREGRVHWTKGGNGIPRIKIYQSEAEQQGQCANNWWSNADYGCNQDATDELKEVFDGVCPFDNPKPSKLIKIIINLGSVNKKAIILDFFAGSGTTGDAVLQLNSEDINSSRSFILCTNNENNICREVTYERIKRVIDKENYEASLKYYKVNYIPIDERMYYEYADELLKHIRELVELENGVNFVGNEEIGIVLTEEELDNFISQLENNTKCRKLYLGHDILMDAQQAQVLRDRKITVNIIPDYYYKELEG